LRLKKQNCDEKFCFFKNLFYFCDRNLIYDNKIKTSADKHKDILEKALGLYLSF